MVRSDSAILLRTNRAGDEALTRNFQLGNLIFQSFVLTTYKIAEKNCVHALHTVHAVPDLRAWDVPAAGLQ